MLGRRLSLTISDISVVQDDEDLSCSVYSGGRVEGGGPGLLLDNSLAVAAASDDPNSHVLAHLQAFRDALDSEYFDIPSREVE